jgi:hypothetical protein
VFKPLYLVGIIVFFTSCEIINPAEQFPAKIYIPALQLQTQSFQGSASQNITEVWVYADGKMMGAFDLPASVPILTEGPSNISLLAGIKNNGISATRIVYPFYSGYSRDLILAPGITDTLVPEFTYSNSLDFWIEAFEDPGIKFVATNTSDTTLKLTQDPDFVFEGSGSGIINLTSDLSYAQVQTEESLQLPVGNQIFAEFDYRCNNSFAVGIKAYRGNDISVAPAVIMNPTDSETGFPEWNKIYVELSYLVGSFPGSDHYELYFEVNLDGGNSDALVQLDNIKIVHFQ